MHPLRLDHPTLLFKFRFPPLQFFLNRMTAFDRVSGFIT